MSHSANPALSACVCCVGGCVLQLIH
uniref:Uncharacterized protein n=1 Tax=Anguilla anguilla TaxID=7936 RepID=A0A0E9Q8Z5_ANGAN